MENYFNYFTEIEEYFQKKRGEFRLLSPIDWALIESFQQAGISGGRRFPVESIKLLEKKKAGVLRALGKSIHYPIVSSPFSGNLSDKKRRLRALPLRPPSHKSIRQTGKTSGPYWRRPKID